MVSSAFFLLSAATLSIASAHLQPAGTSHGELVKRQAVSTVIPTASASASHITRASRTDDYHFSKWLSDGPVEVDEAAGVVAGARMTAKKAVIPSKIGTATTAEATQPLPSTFAAGATPPVAGAPKLPSIATLNPAMYPALDRVPPVDSPEVKQWIAEAGLENAPDFSPTGLGGCANATNAEAVANGGEDGSCWWTCGGCTRATDVTYCPTKADWGASFDDGPSPYTPRLLNLLEEQNLKSTFFVVGSRAVSRPEMVQTEYMLGHHVSIHTWSHMSLTTLTNEEIVAELGWSKKIIKDITGVTPNTMRPPYGDIDDRVRYISLKMGLRPIIWTSYNDQVFDTRDWQIAAGTVNATEVYNNFDRFLHQATNTLSHGFIVLAHDLYQQASTLSWKQHAPDELLRHSTGSPPPQSVDLAADFILPRVINEGRLHIKTIASCLGEDLAQAYIETADPSTNVTQTTATVVGATGVGFVSDVGVAVAVTATATASAGSKSAGSSETVASAARRQSGAGPTTALLVALAAGWAL
ncbi:SPOSA6832_02280, partial [Sporobolomyces salmonicolor]